MLGVPIWSSSSVMACMVNWSTQSLINSIAEIEIILVGKHAFFFYMLICNHACLHDRAKANVACLLAHVLSWVACKMLVTSVNRVGSLSFISKPLPPLITQRSMIVFLLEEKMWTFGFGAICRLGAEVPIPLNLILMCLKEGYWGDLKFEFQALLPWGILPNLGFIQQLSLSNLELLLSLALWVC